MLGLLRVSLPSAGLTKAGVKDTPPTSTALHWMLHWNLSWTTFVAASCQAEMKALATAMLETRKPRQHRCSTLSFSVTGAEVCGRSGSALGFPISLEPCRGKTHTTRIVWIKHKMATVHPGFVSLSTSSLPMLKST